jgi:uncharacterized protein (TIGR00369 family)
MSGPLPAARGGYPHVVDVPPLGPFMEHLGLVFEHLAGDRVVVTWEARPELHQIYGIVHGGVHTSVVESVGSMGAVAWYGDRGRCVGISNHTDFFRAVSEGAMTSTGVPVHQDDSHQVWQVETHDADGRLVSSGQLRVQHLPA